MSKRPISKEKVRVLMDEVIGHAAEEWETLRDGEATGVLFLYYRKPNERQRIGRLKVSDTDPKRGWKRAADMPMSRTWSEAEVKFFIADRLMQLPILRGPFKD